MYTARPNTIKLNNTTPRKLRYTLQSMSRFTSTPTIGYWFIILFRYCQLKQPVALLILLVPTVLLPESIHFACCASIRPPAHLYIRTVILLIRYWFW